MKKHFQLAVLIAVSILTIVLAINAGSHHSECRECSLGQIVK